MNEPDQDRDSPRIMFVERLGKRHGRVTCDLQVSNLDVSGPFAEVEGLLDGLCHEALVVLAEDPVYADSQPVWITPACGSTGELLGSNLHVLVEMVAQGMFDRSGGDGREASGQTGVSKYLCLEKESLSPWGLTY